MHGKVGTTLDLAAWLGVATAKVLIRLWEKLCEVGRIMRTSFSQAYRESRGLPPRTSELRKRRVRAFGFFLIGFQAIALLLVPTTEGFFNPVTFGILVATLWSFPSVWGHIPSFFQKLLLICLVTIVEVAFASLILQPNLLWRVASLVGLEMQKGTSA